MAANPKIDWQAFERTPNEIWAAAEDDRCPFGIALILAMGISAVLWAPILWWVF